MKSKHDLKKKSPDSYQQAAQWNHRMGSHEYVHRRMPYGRYVNWFIKDLPINYLKWAILNLTDTTLCEYLAREYQRRQRSH